MESVVTGKITVCTAPEQAAEGDAVITVTHAKDGFFRKEWFAPGSVLFPMGSYKECRDETLLSADAIVVDHVAQCLHRGALKDLAEAGRIGEKDITATLGELAAGKKTVTASSGSRILCIPIGTGAMDVAAAAVVLQRAEEQSIGGTFDFAV